MTIEPITGLLSRIEFRDFLSLSEWEKQEKINQLHTSRVAAIEQAHQAPKPKQTKSAQKNKKKKSQAKSAEKELAKLLGKMTEAQREALLNKTNSQ